MRQIEDSWQVNLRNPRNDFETMKTIHQKSVLNEEDRFELNSYRKDLIKNLINNKCSSICLNAKEINFKNCFDNCEFKIQNADELFSRSKNEYAEFKRNQSFV